MRVFIDLFVVHFPIVSVLNSGHSLFRGATGVTLAPLLGL